MVLGLGCTATALWNWGLKHLSAGHAGVPLKLEPIVGALLDITVLGDPLHLTTIAGGIFILAASLTISRTCA